MRTKLADRSLPSYTRGEELFNMISHIAGGGFGVIALVLLTVKSLLAGHALSAVTSVLYGLSMIALYAMSSVYHGLRPGFAKKVLQVIDHCTIYFLIAGTYTPIVLVAVRPIAPALGWGLFAWEWALLALAATLTAVDLKKYQIFSMACYIGMGWSVVFFPGTVLAAVGRTGFSLLIAGGVCYTIGAVLYGIGKKKKYMHSIFHLFVLAGSIFHFLTILLYVVP